MRESVGDKRGERGKEGRGWDHYFFQAEDGMRGFCLSRGLGDVYEGQLCEVGTMEATEESLVVDSGSMINALPLALLEAFRVKLQAVRELRVRGAGGSGVRHLGRVRARHRVRTRVDGLLLILFCR